MADFKKREEHQPVLFLPHGGGPLPILGDESHKPLTRFLESEASRLKNFDAILIISAHWEESNVALSSGDNPSLIYDYYGFPPESYQITYPAPGSPALAQQARSLLEKSGIRAMLSNDRGFDHGMFVPMKLMYPQADIPCVQLSLVQGLDPSIHINIGKALAPLRKQGVLIIGSGMSFHNMRAFTSGGNSKANLDFDRWLVDLSTNSEIPTAQREQMLIDWKSAPGARYCHPREEHLLPLHVCFGAASEQTPIAELVFHEELMGYMVSGFIWN